MAFNKCDALRDLTLDRGDWSIKVRVFGTWNGKPVSLSEEGCFNILLIDDDNTRIHAFIGREIRKFYENHIIIGRVYVISNFNVKEYTEKDISRPFRNDKRLFFASDTTVCEDMSLDNLIPKYHFDLFNLSDAEELSDQNLFLTDFVGMVDNIQPICNVKNRITDEDQCYVPFFISDGRNSLKVKLWDKLCHSFLTDMKDIKEHPVIIVIACGKVQNFQGDIYVSNHPATQYFLNCDHYSVRQLRKVLLTSPVNVLVPETELLSNKFYTINEIKAIGKEFINQHMLCSVTITKLEENKKWCVKHCSTCHMVVTKTAGSVRCGNCKKNVLFADKRFKVYAYAKDETGSLNLCIEDVEVRSIIGLDVFGVEAANNIDTDDDEDEVLHPIPYQLKAFEDKRFVVKLLISESNISCNETTYHVTNISIANDLKETVKLKCQAVETPLQFSTSDLDQVPGTSTEGSSTKTRARKNNDVIPFEMDDNTPLQKFRNPKKERVYWKNKSVVNTGKAYSYSMDPNIPLLSLFEVSNLHMRHIDIESKVKCYGTVTKVDTEETWFCYICPRCYCETNSRYGFYHCTNCALCSEEPIRRFKVTVYIGDPLYDIGMILPHHVVTRLCSPGVTHCLEDNVHNEDDFPSLLCEMENKEQLFVVLTKEDNLIGESLYWTCCDSENL